MLAKVNRFSSQILHTKPTSPHEQRPYNKNNTNSRNETKRKRNETKRKRAETKVIGVGSSAKTIVRKEASEKERKTRRSVKIEEGNPEKAKREKKETGQKNCRPICVTVTQKSEKRNHKKRATPDYSRKTPPHKTNTTNETKARKRNDDAKDEKEANGHTEDQSRAKIKYASRSYMHRRHNGNYHDLNDSLAHTSI